MSAASHLRDLSLEIAERAATALALFLEEQASNAAGGRGTHRASSNISRELELALRDLRAAAQEARDAADPL